ncbi:unnamed protein product, partial [Callosobruchus maculatus]
MHHSALVWATPTASTNCCLPGAIQIVGLLKNISKICHLIMVGTLEAYNVKIFS